MLRMRGLRSGVPTQSGAMRADGEGFLYPVIEAAKCAGCGLCASVCPIREGGRLKPARNPRFFAAIHKSEEVLAHSASGGAFTATSDVVPARAARYAALISTKISASYTN